MLQAMKKRHSTTAEALQVAEEMRAHRTVLTHFSSRYPKVGIVSAPRFTLIVDCGCMQRITAMAMHLGWLHKSING